MSPHPLRCRCGTLRGLVQPTRGMSRGVCYCRDCQAFAHFLGRAGDVLDGCGGTDVVATLPSQLRFTQGTEVLTCMSLSETGMLRWYASCCHTPIGNTGRNPRLSYVGLVHSSLDQAPAASMDASFGPVRMRMGTGSATGPEKPPGAPLSNAWGVLRFGVTLARARLGGAWRETPFFHPGDHTPVRAPRVLSEAERGQLMRSF